MGIKYNFKKIKYDVKKINNKYLDECNKIIESKEYDKNIKNIYTSIRNYLTNCLKYELVINNLDRMKELCNDAPYSNILGLISNLIIKYTDLYGQNSILLHNAIKGQELVELDGVVIKK